MEWFGKRVLSDLVVYAFEEVPIAFCSTTVVRFCSVSLVIFLFFFFYA